MTKSDVLIIGAGPGGYNTAVEAVAEGLSVTLIERGELGGTCLNRGCIPTKCFCRSADAALTLADAAQLGVAPEPVTPSVNMERVVARKDEVVAQLREGIAMLLKGVNVVPGEARFVDESTVEVNGETYTAPKV
ncbi:MAG: FAD-dependent oxidoreductase, partial [Duncaniella sp.]|nr:FAD-dependent oxidoreductase [Duncaniella sp.]